MAPSVPLQAWFRKWSGLNCVESCLIVSSAVLKVLISAHCGDWLWVKCVLMNTNLRCGLGLSRICWVNESSRQVIRLLQVYRRALSSLRDTCGDAKTLDFLPGENIVSHCQCIVPSTSNTHTQQQSAAQWLLHINAIFTHTHLLRPEEAEIKGGWIC